MQLEKLKRSGWEYFLVSCVVGCVVILSLALYSKRDHLNKSQRMRWELLTLRNTVTAYTLEHRKHPTSLDVVLSPWSIVHGPWSNSDPFGNLYQYDPKSGWVNSTTRGYASW